MILVGHERERERAYDDMCNGLTEYDHGVLLEYLGMGGI